MNYRIKDIDKSLRPRERAIKYGLSSLSDDELLSIIIGSGTKSKNVKTLSLDILNRVGSLNNFLSLDISELKKIKGIGNAKALDILASIEFGKRILSYHKDNVRIANAKEVYNLYKYSLIDKEQEVFMALYLDNSKKLIKDKILFKGTINSCNVNPREIFKYALRLSASSIILIHNHPSNNVTPSQDDIIITNKLISLGKELSIPILDHIIIGKDKYFSIVSNQLSRENN